MGPGLTGSSLTSRIGHRDTTGQEGWRDGSNRLECSPAWGTGRSRAPDPFGQAAVSRPSGALARRGALRRASRRDLPGQPSDRLELGQPLPPARRPRTPGTPARRPAAGPPPFDRRGHRPRSCCPSSGNTILNFLELGMVAPELSLPDTPHRQWSASRQRLGVNPPGLGSVGNECSFLAWGLRHQAPT